MVKIFEAIGRRLKFWDKESADAVDVGASEKIRQASEDLEKNLYDLIHAMASLQSQVNTMERQLELNHESAKKYVEGAKALSAQPGQEENAKKAQDKAMLHLQTAETLKKSIETLKQRLEDLKKQKEKLEQKRSEAKLKGVMARANEATTNALKSVSGVDAGGSAVERIDEAFESSQQDMESAQAFHEIKTGESSDEDLEKAIENAGAGSKPKNLDDLEARLAKL